MRLLCLVVVAGLWCTSLAAQTITVRSGEHGAFTRLALDVPAGVKWELNPTSDGYTLSLKMDGAFLDTTRVFSRINQSRIRELRARGSELDILLACDCRAVGFLEQGKMLVIDISDTTEADNSGLATSADPEHVAQAIEAPSQITDPGFGYGELLWRSRADAQPKDEAAISDVSSTENPADTPQADQPASGDPRSIDIRQAESELLEGIGTAATRGLLDPNLEIVRRDNEHAGSESIETHDATSTIDRDPFDQRENVRVRSGMFEARQGENDQSINKDGYVCPDPELLAIQDWGDDSGFAAQVGSWRSKLTREFDHIDSDSIVGLARTYLYFGFGAEARRVLSLDEEIASENDLLLELADIFDLGYGEDGNLLLPYSNCDSAFALWSIMAHQNLPPDIEVNTDAALLALNHLPVHLRKHLGPILSNRLLDHGDSDAASGVLRTVNRALKTPQAGVQMAEANLALKRGELQDAQEMLEEVVESNATMSPAALIALVDAKLDRNEVISVETATLAAAFAHEHRDTELGPELRRVHVLARSRSNQFDTAFDALDRLRSRDGGSSTSDLKSQVLQLLTENADDVTFMRFSMLQSDLDMKEIDDEVANGIAGRLLSLGFDTLASSWLVDPSRGPADRNRRLLRARIALKRDSPLQAEAELIGLHGEDVDRLTAQARSIMGDHAAAIEMFDSTQSTKDALREAWLSEDWRRLAASEDPLYEEVAGLMEQSSQTGEGETTSASDAGVLTQNRMLLQQSATTRSVLTALLEAKSMEGP